MYWGLDRCPLLYFWLFCWCAILYFECSISMCCTESWRCRKKSKRGGRGRSAQSTAGQTAQVRSGKDYVWWRWIPKGKYPVLILLQLPIWRDHSEVHAQCGLSWGGQFFSYRFDISDQTIEHSWDQCARGLPKLDPYCGLTSIVRDPNNESSMYLVPGREYGKKTVTLPVTSC